MEKYKELNKEAKNYFLDLVKKEERDTDKALFERYIKEINILCEDATLIILKYLYEHKLKNKNVEYYFPLELNNMAFLYKIGLINVDPIKYELPYELIRYTGNVELRVINESVSSLINDINNMQNDFTLCYGNITNVSHLDDSINVYVLKQNNEIKEDIEYNEDGLPIIYLDDDAFAFETTLVIEEKKIEKLPKKKFYDSLEDYERKVYEILKPKNDEENIKSRLLAVNNFIFETEQDKLLKDGIITLDNAITSREDIFNYLRKHNIDTNRILKIIRFVKYGKARKKKDPEDWEKYKNLMKENNCEDWFIGVLEKITYITNASFIISDYLYRFY